MTHEERLALAVQFNQERLGNRTAGVIATKHMIVSGDLTDEEMSSLVGIFPKYSVGINYKVGDTFSYLNKLYEVIQEHTSQEYWNPDSTPSIYNSKTPEGVIADWVQPLGAHDAYSSGDVVMYDENKWVSTENDNVWRPGEYGWNIVN